MGLYEGLSLAILSEVENGITKSELIKKYGQWGGIQERVFNRLVEKNVLRYQNDKVEFSTADLVIFTKRIKMLENSIDAYLSLLPEKDFVPWGVLVFLSGEKLCSEIENKIIYSIGKKTDIKSNIIWKVYKNTFETGYADLKQIIRRANIYLEDISEITNDLLIFPNLIKIRKSNGTQYLIFSRDFKEWIVTK